MSRIDMSPLLQPIPTPARAVWGSVVEQERKRRIKVSLAAFAYEVRNVSIMSDHEFDMLARAVQPHIVTGHPVLDKFFREQFDPSTGMWVHQHPDFHALAALYSRYYAHVQPVRIPRLLPVPRAAV